MMILSNSMTQTADEGSLKLATSIVSRIKKAKPDTCVICFEREWPRSDLQLRLNKFHISWELIKILRQKKEPVLYIPFPAPTLSMALRIRLLSLFARHGLRVMMIRQYPIGKPARILLRRSRAELVVFSRQARDYYCDIVGDRVMYLKTGVDTEKYRPVPDERARELKRKYGFDPDKPLVLHVGHMKEGRNVASLMEISHDYQVLLVISTLSKERQDGQLRSRLEACGNITVVDRYIPNIEEIYQMCDVYFFPVRQAGHCIDVPLSCLEAAGCGKPVITTDFGEMKAFAGKDGFHFIDDFSSGSINRKLAEVLEQGGGKSRIHVLPYDWQNSVRELTNDMK